jgi:hypothetical protein
MLCNALLISCSGRWWSGPAQQPQRQRNLSAGGEPGVVAAGEDQA